MAIQTREGSFSGVGGWGGGLGSSFEAIWRLSIRKALKPPKMLSVNLLGHFFFGGGAI